MAEGGEVLLDRVSSRLRREMIEPTIGRPRENCSAAAVGDHRVGRIFAALASDHYFRQWIKESRPARVSAARLLQRCGASLFGSAMTMTTIAGGSQNPSPKQKGGGVVRTSCGDCGASIGCPDDGLAHEFYVAIEFLDRPERFEPQAHAYWNMKLPWVNFADDLPKTDAYTRPRDPDFGYPSGRQRS